MSKVKLAQNIAFSFQRRNLLTFRFCLSIFILKPLQKFKNYQLNLFLIYLFRPNVQKTFGGIRQHFLNVFCTFIWMFGACFCILKDTAFCLRVSLNIISFLGVQAFLKGWKTTLFSHVSLRETCFSIYFFPILLLLLIGISLINLVLTHN